MCRLLSSRRLLYHGAMSADYNEQQIIEDFERRGVAWKWGGDGRPVETGGNRAERRAEAKEQHRWRKRATRAPAAGEE